MQNQSAMQTPREKGSPSSSSSYTCFRCNKPGHFIKDCPQTTPKRTPFSDPISSTISDPDFPTTYCRCQAGFCQIRVSNSQNNPGRKYYRCPAKFDKNCAYFKWCDMLREDEVRKSKPEMNFPTCQCGAGVCMVRVQESGPHKGRSFFACPIKKGDGACSFKQWLDNSPHSALIIPEDEAAERNSLLEEFDLSYEDEMQIDAIEIGARESPLKEVPTGMDGQQNKTSDGVHEIYARSDAIDPPEPLPIENNEIHPRSVKNNAIQNSLGLESATENQVNGSAIANVQQSVTTVVATNPHSPASPGTFPSFDPVTMPEDNASPHSVILEDSSEERFDASPGLDNQPWSGGLLQDGLNKRTSMSGIILKAFETSAHHFQNELVTILESMDPKDHEAMSKEANCTFAALDHLQVDYGLFRLRVTECIKQAASLAHIEQTISEDTPSKELLNRYEIEKSHFHEVLHAYGEANNAYVASSKKLKTCRKDAAYLRELLVELEKELGHYEVENVRNQESLDRISKTMSECKASFWKATEAVNQYEKREIERNAAKAAFKTAKAQLRN